MLTHDEARRGLVKWLVERNADLGGLTEFRDGGGAWATVGWLSSTTLDRILGRVGVRVRLHPVGRAAGHRPSWMHTRGGPRDLDVIAAELAWHPTRASKAQAMIWDRGPQFLGSHESLCGVSLLALGQPDWIQLARVEAFEPPAVETAWWRRAS